MAAINNEGVFYLLSFVECYYIFPSSLDPTKNTVSWGCVGSFVLRIKSWSNKRACINHCEVFCLKCKIHISWKLFPFVV